MRLINYFLSDYICSKLSIVKHRIISLENQSLLMKNEKYKNIHNGERCFILGNGPSLNQLDFSLLKDEFVFTVNQIARTKSFEQLHINYHIWADPYFFKLDLSKSEDIELLDQMKNVRTKYNSPMCFFPIEQKNFVDKNFNSSLEYSFFYPSYALKYNMGRKIDFTKITPAFYTVVQYAVILAIYMGFNEIYLLGCETSNILTSINTRLNEFYDNSYGYLLTNKEKCRMKKVSNLITFRDELFNNLNLIDDYHQLNQYCLKRKIRLSNCTPGGLLEEIPRLSIEEVLKIN